MRVAARQAEVWEADSRSGGRLPERARELADAVGTAGRAVGVLPKRVEVPHPDVAEALGRELAGHGIVVEYGDSEELFDAMNAVLASLDPGPMQGRMTVALTWRETEPTAQELTEFHQAAAAFYSAEPWNDDEGDGLFLLDLPGGRQWAGCVMG